jgi:hypothetical protein
MDDLDADERAIGAAGGPVMAEVGASYQHRKGGIYEVKALAKVEATLAWVVVYRGADGQTWTRPIDEFCDGRFVRLTP